MPVRTPPPSASGGGSCGAIRPSNTAEQRNVRASTTSATGADSARTSNPAALGPATNENARLPLRSELPSTNLSRGTIETKSEASETPNSTLSDPAPNATMSNWMNVRLPIA